jgi:hypothetical protein
LDDPSLPRLTHPLLEHIGYREPPKGVKLPVYCVKEAVEVSDGKGGFVVSISPRSNVDIMACALVAQCDILKLAK